MLLSLHYFNFVNPNLSVGQMLIMVRVRGKGYSFQLSEVPYDSATPAPSLHFDSEV